MNPVYNNDILGKILPLLLTTPKQAMCLLRVCKKWREVLTTRYMEQLRPLFASFYYLQRSSPPNVVLQNLTGANLSEIYIKSSLDFRGANFKGADLSRATLKGNLSGADLSDANLIWATLKGNLSGANLSGANLSGANLSGANFTGANLESADLSSANLESVDFTCANLTEANLNRTNLTSAVLTDANLRNSYLIDAVLTDANLTYAATKGAVLTNAVPTYVFNADDFRFLEDSDLED